MKKLIAIVSFAVAASFCQAAGFAIGPIGGGGGSVTTTVVLAGDQVTMSSEVLNGADDVQFTIKDPNGNVVYSGHDVPDSNNLVEFSWFPLFDGTFTVEAESYLGGVSLGTQVIDLGTSVRPDASGFITGGGWYNQSGQRNNFGFNAQVLGNGSVKGNLQFQDRVRGINVHSNSVNWVYAPNCNVGYFSGWCKLNGQGNYRFFVEVYDNGEPGTSDSMALWVYDSFGNLLFSYSGVINGGNMQIHCR